MAEFIVVHESSISRRARTYPSWVAAAYPRGQAKAMLLNCLSQKLAV